MKLADYQRAIARASLSLEVEDAELRALGDASRFRMYRRMVRSRLENMAQVAYRGTLLAVGHDAFAASFARFLAEVGPTSRYLRDVIDAYGLHALDDRQLHAEAPAHARDLLTFEHEKWCVAYRLAAAPKAGEGEVREFDFEGVPVLNPVLSRLRLAHAVHEAEPRAKSTLLFVYRPPQSDQLRWYGSEPFFFAVLECASEREQPFVVSVREAAEREGRTLDQELVETLSNAIATALERGVLIGSR